MFDDLLETFFPDDAEPVYDIEITREMYSVAERLRSNRNATFAEILRDVFGVNIPESWQNDINPINPICPSKGTGAVKVGDVE